MSDVLHFDVRMEFKQGVKRPNLEGREELAEKIEQLLEQHYMPSDQMAYITVDWVDDGGDDL